MYSKLKIGMKLRILKVALRFWMIFLAVHPASAGQTGTAASWGQFTIPAVPVGTSYRAIAGGSFHSLALRTNGRVVSWGGNDAGACIVPDDLTNVLAISAGSGFNLARKANGTVAAWGDDYYGQSDVPNGLSNVTAIAAGDYHSLALRAGGTVVAWGGGMTNTGSSPDFGQSIVPNDLNGVTAIAAGMYHSLALKSDGTIVGWGMFELRFLLV
jgi:alpha-tubulin suppressor-like RCC1 family protein